jgi:predicted SprT family Zn-dependent metalloprotease
MTTIEEVRNMARPLMDAHGLSHWLLVFDNAKSRAGQCQYPFWHAGVRTPGKISLSRHFVRLNSMERIRLTLVHEMAHAIVGNAHGHDRVWRAKCLALGGDGKARFTENDTVMALGKYTGLCPTNPAHTYQRHRMTENMRRRTLYCRHCTTATDRERGRLTWRRNA